MIPLLLIMASLAEGAKHGYAITRDVQEIAGVTLGPGTLYGAIARLEERGLIEPLEADDRRRPYRLTGSGAAVLREQLTGAGARGERWPSPPVGSRGTRMRKRLLSLYPEAWRDRYGEEMSALLDQTPPSVTATLDLLRGALTAHLRPLASSAPGARARGTIGQVLGCFIVFWVVGSGFAKTTENYDYIRARPSAARHFPLGDHGRRHRQPQPRWR